MSLIPVGNSDFFLVLHLQHVDYSMFSYLISGLILIAVCTKKIDSLATIMMTGPAGRFSLLSVKSINPSVLYF